MSCWFIPERLTPLPLLHFMQGQIRKVVDTGSVSTAQVMVLNELRMLCVWMGCQIGLLSGKHAHVITSTPFVASIVNVKHALHRKKFYSSGIKLVCVGNGRSHFLPHYCCPDVHLLRPYPGGAAGIHVHAAAGPL